MIEYNYNKKNYLYNAFQYFAIAFTKLFDGKVRYNLGLIGRKDNELDIVAYNNGCFNSVLYSFDARYISTKIKDTNEFQPCLQR